jgi:hypothetical protein
VRGASGKQRGESGAGSVKKFMRVVLNFSFYCVFVPDVFVNFGLSLVLTSKCVLQHKGENNENTYRCNRNHCDFSNILTG